MTEFLSADWLGNTVQAWGLALGLALAVTVALGVLVRWLARRVAALAARTATGADDIAADLLGRTKSFFFVALGILAGAQMLAFPGGVRTALLRAVIVVLLLQAGLWASALVVALLKEYQSRNLETDPAAATTIGALVFIGRLIVWTLVLVIALDNLGVDITALVTGLGIGGIAVALAVQNVLGDLLASLSIVLDKPFVVGDFLAVDNLLGSVEDVGLRTTRLRSLSGEQLVFSNTDLLKSRVRNFGRMYERRILFGIGVTYDTPREKLQRIPGILREAVESQEKVRFDRAHFKAFGPYSLDFEVVYYVTVPDYGAYMDAQQAVNFRIHEGFEEAGIEFAFPTQTLHLVRPDAAGTEA
jgi:small-conductance mechanosensitive channel